MSAPRAWRLPLRSRPRIRFPAAAVVALTPLAARADTPMSYLHGEGERAYPVVSLTWGLIAVSVTVVVIIGVLLLGGIFRRRAPLQAADPGRLPVVHGGGLSWITIGTGVSTVVLFAFAIWSFVVLAAVGAPPRKPAFTVEITGHQWWWEARYETDDPARTFFTANEIHIPIGQPVLFRLRGADVIHSFWVPALTGKTDLIPGQTNTMWIEAGKPGIYRGQCTEYCGLQHAHMALFVYADRPDRFDAWWEHQLAAAASPDSRDAAIGEKTFLLRCSACHTVRGTGAGGKVGPDLTHVMSRGTIAAGTLPNTVGNLSGWIANPQHVKPGNRMPTIDLTSAELVSIRRYLETLH